MTARLVAKRIVQAFGLAIALIPAVLSGFGRLHQIYTFFAQSYALIPGVPGNFLRAAYYRLTLEDCSVDISIAFGSFFSHSGAHVGCNVSIGSFCVIGKARIDARSQIASHVEIPSSAREHRRDDEGKLSSVIEEEGTRIGADCWIGSSAVILAEVGSGSTIGAGAVVVRPVPPRSVAVGNPARVINPAGVPASEPS
jgi:acetyltransferase-like isoleucine patch superfamily enzyme